MGFNSQDQLLGQPFFVSNNAVPTDDSSYNNYINRYIPDSAAIDDINNIYYPIDDFVNYTPVAPPPFLGLPPWPEINNIMGKWYQMNADTCYICGTLYTASIIAANDNININENVNVYVYNLKGISPYYTIHGSDILYLFDTSIYGGNGPPFFKFLLGVPTDIDLSTQMINLWLDFVIDNSLNNWNVFGQNGNVFEFESGNNSHNVNDYFNTYRNGVCKFWIDQVGLDVMNDMCFQNFGFVE